MGPFRQLRGNFSRPPGDSNFRSAWRGPAPGILPIRVNSLDENFIVVRKDANLALSHDLRGFHMYGTELCVIASILGLTAYVVDFHLRHLSGGVRDEFFAKVRAEMIAKYGRALRPRIIKTPTAIFVLGSSSLLTRLLNTHLATRIIERSGYVFGKKR